MPELPEVENFRQLLLPLVSASAPLCLELLNNNPPKTFLSVDQVKELSGNYVVKNVLRKGKLICMVLGHCNVKQNQPDADRYMFIHMGMTGRISSPTNIPKLEEVKDVVTYPPRFTYLRLRAGDAAEACFSDPRKFGSIKLDSNLDAFEELAPDGLELKDAKGLEGQTMGIKGILLDQKRVVSGVGNWVADEVLYRSEIHPDQSMLTAEEANRIFQELQFILATAVECLQQRQDFPTDWLFHFRWSKRKGSAKDSKGRTIAFTKSGGRTSAYVPSIQKNKGRAKAKAAVKKKAQPQATEDPRTTDKKATKQETPRSLQTKRKTAHADSQPATRSLRRSPRLSSS